VETAWHVLRFVQESVARLEDGATRVAAAQVAGFVALWTQLTTFERGPPRVLAWIAWAILLGALGSLAPVVTPRRLARFWASVLPRAGHAVGEAVPAAKELKVVEGLIESLAGQYARMYRHPRFSIFLSLLGVGIAALAYVIEKVFYAT